jgi:hypothetical protein
MKTFPFSRRHIMEDIKGENGKSPHNSRSSLRFDDDDSCTVVFLHTLEVGSSLNVSRADIASMYRVELNTLMELSNLISCRLQCRFVQTEV